MTVIKKDFDDFNCSQACMQATEKYDAIVPATVSVMTSESSSSMVPVTTSKSSPSTVSVMTSESSSSTMSVTTSKRSSDDHEDQDVLVYSDGKAALDHVLFDVCQPWCGPLAEALERSGCVLLMNQAKRDMLTFLNANGVVTPLPQVQKNMLLDVKLISSYCERNSRPIVNWMEISKADFNSVTLYMEEEKVTIPHHTKESHVDANKPKNETSIAMVTSTSMINYLNASPDIKVIDGPEIEAVNNSLVEQTPPKSPTYEAAPVKQQDTLHNFLCYVDQGTFGIPCKGKIFHSSPYMDSVAWPQEKSAHLPRTLAQLAHQDFKKEPPNGIAAMLHPQYPIVPCILQPYYFGSIIGTHVFLWLKHNFSRLPVYHKFFLHGNYSNMLVMLKTCRVSKLMDISNPIHIMLLHTSKLTAGGFQITPEAPIPGLSH